MATVSRHGVHGLQRQPVQQVEIDPVDAHPAQTLDGQRRLFEALQPIDGSLHGGIEALNAQTRAVDAAVAERLRHLLGQRTRIDFDGDFGVGQDEKRIAQRTDEIHEGFGRHDRRRAAAEVNMGNRQSLADCFGDKARFATQARCIGRDRIVALGHGRMATAVPAHRPAERYMQVDRRRLPDRHRLQPIPIILFANRRRKMRGRGITGVARQPVLPVGLCQVRSHLLFSLRLRIITGLVAEELCAGSIHRKSPDRYVRRSSFATLRTADVTIGREDSTTSLKPRLAGGTPAAQPPVLGSRMKSVM